MNFRKILRKSLCRKNKFYGQHLITKVKNDNFLKELLKMIKSILGNQYNYKKKVNKITVPQKLEKEETYNYIKITIYSNKAIFLSLKYAMNG